MTSSAKAAMAVIFFVLLSSFCVAQSAPPPSWLYSSYFGGKLPDTITALTTDGVGNVYMAGTTSSPDFPTTAGAYETVFPGPASYDNSVVFVAKFSSDGSLLWSTFVGPITYTFAVASAIQVDAEQNVYIAGIFQTAGFPNTAGPPNYGSVFVTKLNSSGSQLIYSWRIGPDSILSNPELVLDSLSDAFVIGSGPAGDCCNSSHSAIIGSLGGIDDFWITEINAAGTGMPWSVQMGGNGEDEAYGLAIDAENNLYVAGYTGSANFPSTAGALDQPGGGRTFVAKLNPAKLPQRSLVYSAIAGNPGGNSNDYLQAQSAAVDAEGNAYVGTWTYNLGLFTSPWAFQTTAPAVPNAYVFELNSSGSAIVNGTYIGGGGDDYVGQVSVDNTGNTYVSGFTSSWDFLTTAYGDLNPSDSLSEAYTVKLNPQFAAVSSIEFGSTHYGAEAFAEATDGSGGLWAAGYTGIGFPVTANAYQSKFGGKYDGFLLHTDFAGLCASTGVAICEIAPDNALPERIHFTSQAENVEDNVNMSLAIDGMSAYSLNATQFDTWLPVAPGNHTASVTAQTANGQQYQAQQNFTVATESGCPLNPTDPSITFCSPLNAAVLTSPVTIQIQANDPVPIPSLALYVDGVLQGTLTGQKGVYSTTLSLSAGVHTFSAQGTDNNSRSVANATVARVGQ